MLYLLAINQLSAFRVVYRCGEIAYKCTLQEKTCKFLLRIPQKFLLYTLFESNLVSQIKQ